MDIISLLQEAMESNTESLFEAKDGVLIHITPDDAQSLAVIHDALNLNNQRVMRSLMEESGKNFFNVLTFCYKHTTEEEH
jgi:hypothetical protein